MENHSKELLGQVEPINDRFPLLIKLLDAKQQLSLQVHPPHAVATKLGGEPKTECWLMLDGTNPNATIAVGLKKISDQETLKTAIANGTIESMVSNIPVKKDDCMFLPSGRLHAIGAGCLILEIQENSNTTYRVFDWNRIDPKTNRSRELHVEKALASIDFVDIQPQLQQPMPIIETTGETLVRCPQFVLERWRVTDSNEHRPIDSFEVVTCLTGTLTLNSGTTELTLPPMTTSLIPASIASYAIHGNGSYSRVFVPSAL
jgi:mannose-6-phosphate isomerase